MKLRSFSISKPGGDHVAVATYFTDRFRRPLKVTLSAESLDAPGEIVSWSGDTFDVMGLFGGVAEIAWAMGWRPRGLDAVLAHAVKAYKIPKEEA